MSQSLEAVTAEIKMLDNIIRKQDEALELQRSIIQSLNELVVLKNQSIKSLEKQISLLESVVK